MAALAPDVILAHANAAVGALLQATRTIPVVFPVVGDPVASGYVDSLSRPGSNATGFAQFEFSLSGKWLELLKEIASEITRAAILRDTEIGSGTSQFAVIQSVAPSLRLDVRPINVRDAAEIEQSLGDFGASPKGGLIVTGGGAAQRHRDLIVALAVRHKLPTVYFDGSFVSAGGVNFLRREHD